MWFPASMTRVNAEEPDTTYTAGSHVVLSPSDSMIYQWRFNSSWTRCYISGWVSPLEKLIQGGKSYSAEGDVTEIEVWNVDYPSDSNLPSLSWNTRPTRQSLLGTVNFTDYDVQRQLFHSDGKELKSPTPLFECIDRRTITLEIACKACRLEFDQVFSDPALGTCLRSVTFTVIEIASFTGFELIELA
ncbi:hypothetical protein BDZ89DRAFT_957999 [Hymenopellis radicata]|nr:hypothetical protein BDZ89DRAFT_957999 [Hymenopellis radicata]